MISTGRSDWALVKPQSPNISIQINPAAEARFRSPDKNGAIARVAVLRMTTPDVWSWGAGFGASAARFAILYK
jgi:hypothetical protein